MSPLAGPIVALTLLVAFVKCDGQAYAVTLWTEDAESGYGNVIDNTDASYPLIQSDVVGEGNAAFHLAHPVGQDSSFQECKARSTVECP